MKRIKKDDTVIALAGRDKEKQGKVLSVDGDKIVVEGVNFVKKHVKPNPQLQQQGGIISKEAWIHVSNLALVNPISGKADKVGFKFIDVDGAKKKVRYFKSNNELVDIA